MENLTTILFLEISTPDMDSLTQKPMSAILFLEILTSDSATLCQKA